MVTYLSSLPVWGKEQGGTLALIRDLRGSVLVAAFHGRRIMSPLPPYMVMK